MRRDTNFDKNDDYTLPLIEDDSKTYHVKLFNKPHLFYQGKDLYGSVDYAYMWVGSKNLKYAKSIADQISKKLNLSIVVIENYGMRNEKEVYIIYPAQ